MLDDSSLEKEHKPQQQKQKTTIINNYGGIVVTAPVEGICNGPQASKGASIAVGQNAGKSINSATVTSEMCKCGQLKECKVLKSGPNKGRTKVDCPKPYGQQCPRDTAPWRTQSLLERPGGLPVWPAQG